MKGIACEKRYLRPLLAATVVRLPNSAPSGPHTTRPHKRKKPPGGGFFRFVDPRGFDAPPVPPARRGSPIVAGREKRRAGLRRRGPRSVEDNASAHKRRRPPGGGLLRLCGPEGIR